MSYGGTRLGILGAGGFRANAVAFDGASDSLFYGSDFTGVVDGKIFLASVWVKTTANGTILGNGFWDIRLIGGVVDLLGTNSSTSTVLSICGSTTITDGAWHHILAVVDLSDTGKRFIYVDDVAETLTVATYVDDTIDFTRGSYYFGANSVGAQNWAFDCADAYIDIGNYLDISSASNREKFIDGNGKPVDLGGTGELPTGTSPISFNSGATAAWHTNKGTGGGYTENGALTTASTSPSD